MNNLKKIRKELNLTQAELSKKFNISQQTVSNWENNITEIDQENLRNFSDYFKVSIDYLLGQPYSSNNNALNLKSYDNISPICKRKIPLLGDIACGKPIFTNEDRENYIECGTDIKADFCLKAKGDSMINARILDGDIVFIKAQEMVSNGEIAAVIIGDEATLKRVYYYREKNKLILQAENSAYEPLVFIDEELNDIRIIGKAIAFQSNVK